MEIVCCGGAGEEGHFCHKVVVWNTSKKDSGCLADRLDMAVWCRKLYHACVYIYIHVLQYVYIYIFIYILLAAQQNSNPPFFPRTKNGRFTWKVFSKKLGRMTVCRCVGSDQRTMTPSICAPRQKSCLSCWVKWPSAGGSNVETSLCVDFQGWQVYSGTLFAVTHATGSCWVFITNRRMEIQHNAAVVY